MREGWSWSPPQARKPPGPVFTTSGPGCAQTRTQQARRAGLQPQMPAVPHQHPLGTRSGCMGTLLLSFPLPRPPDSTPQLGCCAELRYRGLRFPTCQTLGKRFVDVHWCGLIGQLFAGCAGSFLAQHGRVQHRGLRRPLLTGDVSPGWEPSQSSSHNALWSWAAAVTVQNPYPGLPPTTPLLLSPMLGARVSV